jgi:hypothetical protein
VSDPTQPQWPQQPQPPAVPGQQYPPQPGAYPQQPQGQYPPQGYPQPQGQYPPQGYPQQPPYGPPPVNVNVQSGSARSVTRAHIGPGFHFFHASLTFCTGGLWGVVYAWQWYKKSRPITVTTHER